MRSKDNTAGGGAYSSRQVPGGRFQVLESRHERDDREQKEGLSFRPAPRTKVFDFEKDENEVEDSASPQHLLDAPKMDTSVVT